MAFARVYVGAHYPGDVVAGLALGATVALAANQLGVRLIEAVLTAASKTPLRALVTTARRSDSEFVRT